LSLNTLAAAVARSVSAKAIVAKMPDAMAMIISASLLGILGADQHQDDADDAEAEAEDERRDHFDGVRSPVERRDAGKLGDLLLVGSCRGRRWRLRGGACGWWI
jgi:hypothetical protein